MARILLIDDDASLLQMVRLMLEREGHQVVVAEGGEEGIAAAQAQNPDLAIVDLMMPGMSGYGVTRAFRNNARTAAMPVLILTARGQPMDRQMALEAGANAYLAKPISSKELLAKITEILENPPPPAASAPDSGAAPPERTASPRRPIGATDVVGEPARANPAARRTSFPTNLPVLTVIGLRGGSGATTVAVNLAMVLQERKKARTCIVDLSRAGGHVGLHLRMVPRQSWGDLLGAGDAADARLIGSTLTAHPGTGLSVLAAPSIPSMNTLSQNAMIHILSVLSGNYQQIVVDADGLNPASVGALLVSHAVIVVMGDDVMAVHTTSNMMQSLQNLGVEMGRVRVCVNHTRSDPGVPSQTILKALGRPIAAEIPYDANQVQAMRRGTPLVTATPDSAFAQAMIQLLRTI
jgi:twitching motility two-component system response regulator PilH